jgi:uncharacterized membrane protein (DUF485 family)
VESSAPQVDPAVYSEVEASEEFRELRRSYRAFTFPVTLAFLSWYLLYVLLSSFAGGFMSTKVVGHINLALVLGVAQFATTFLIAWLYARYADTRLDPTAGRIKARIEGRVEARGTVTGPAPGAVPAVPVAPTTPEETV